MGYTLDNGFKTWLRECVSEVRGPMPRYNVQIEMIDINSGAPQSKVNNLTGGVRVWMLTNAWVAKYNAPDLNALQSEVAIETLELAYEELVIPN